MLNGNFLSEFNKKFLYRWWIEFSNYVQWSPDNSHKKFVRIKQNVRIIQASSQTLTILEMVSGLYCKFSG